MAESVASLVERLTRRANALENSRDNGYCSTGRPIGCHAYWYPKGKTEHIASCDLLALINDLREAASRLSSPAHTSGEMFAAGLQTGKEVERMSSPEGTRGDIPGPNSEVIRRVLLATKMTCNSFSLSEHMNAKKGRTGENARCTNCNDPQWKHWLRDAVITADHYRQVSSPSSAPAATSERAIGTCEAHGRYDCPHCASLEGTQPSSPRVSSATPEIANRLTHIASWLRTTQSSNRTALEDAGWIDRAIEALREQQ